MTVLADVLMDWAKEVHSSLVSKNQGRASLFIGSRGSGKSWSAASLADELLGGGFSLERDIAFLEAWPAIRLIRQAKPMDVKICDDMGVGLSSRQWGQQKNIFFGQVWQTCRTRNAWIIVTTIKRKLIDVQVREMFDDLIIMENIDYKTRTAKGQWRLPNVNFLTNKQYWNPIKINGRKYTSVHFAAPREELGANYDRMRKEAEDKLHERLEKYELGLMKSITVKQAASILRMDPLQVSQLCAEGEIAGSESSSSFKVSLGWVNDILETLNLGPGEQVMIANKSTVAGQDRCYPLLKSDRVLVKGNPFFRGGVL